MFTIKQSKNKSFRSNRMATPQSVGADSSLGADSKTILRGMSDQMVSQSNVSTSNSLFAQTGADYNISGNAITIDMDPLLTGLTPQLMASPQYFSLFKDIYYHDSVAGSAVDLISQVTFASEFTLGGVSSPKIAQVYEECIDRLNIKALMPEMSTDHLVLGTHCSSLLYNKKKRMFVDLMCHPVENLVVTDMPFYSQDPLLTVKFSDAVRNACSTTSPSAAHLTELVGEEIMEKIRAGALDLDPWTTIYLPRKTFSYTEIGTSYYKRILPLYLIEKNLYRGTLIESARRQRGIMHLTLGDGDDWIPKVADLEFMTSLFMKADSDPLGAIVATRSGVQVDEIRQGGDFWKVTDFSDSVMSYKLRALGISEGFLSGDANFNTADQSLTIFVEMLRAYRDSMTRKFFYDRLFPLISMVHGYAVNSKGKVTVREELKNVSSLAEALKMMNDGSKLLIPTVTWAKSLKPEGDSSYLEMLGTMAEKGVPVPLRVLAAAGGLNLDDLLRQQEDDLDLRKKMAEYNAKIAEFAPKQQEEGEARAVPLSSISGASNVLSANGGRRPALLNREFDSEPTALSKTGKRKAVPSHLHKSKDAKINKLIVKAMKVVHKRTPVRRTSFKAKTTAGGF